MGETSLCLHLLFIWMTFEMLSIYGTAWTEQKNTAQALAGSLNPATGFLIFQFCLFLATCLPTEPAYLFLRRYFLLIKLILKL